MLDTIEVVKVYKYGLVPSGDIPKEAIDQLYYGHKLWNTLVEHSQQATEKYFSIVNNSSSELSELTSKIEQVKSDIDELFKQKRAQRALERKRNVENPDFDAKIKASKAELKELSLKSKEMRASAKEIIKPLLDEHTAWDFARVKEIRQNSGAHWGVYEPIMDSFKVARGSALKKGNGLRFQRFDGQGQWKFRISGGFTFDKLLSSKVALSVKNESVKKKRYPVMPFDFKIAGAVLNFHMHYHRPLPADALIKMVTINRERIGDRFKYSACFTIVEKKEVQLHQNEDAVGVDLGFLESSGGLKIATTWDGKQQTVLNLPQKWVGRRVYVEDTLSALQESANAFVERLKLELSGVALDKEHKCHGTLNFIKSLDVSKKSFSFRSLIRLQKASTYESISPKVDAMLEDWVVNNIRKVREADNLSAKLIKQRNHIYREWASKVTKQYGRIVIEDLSLKDIAEVKDKDNVLHQSARSKRFAASLSTLILALKNACSNNNSEFIQKDPAHTTTVCSTCLTNNEVLDREFTCTGCGEVHEQDLNAAKNLLKLDVNRLESMGLLLVKNGFLV